MTRYFVYALLLAPWMAAVAAPSPTRDPSYSTLVGQALIMVQTTDGRAYARRLLDDDNVAAVKGVLHACGTQHTKSIAQTFTISGTMLSRGRFVASQVAPKDARMDCFVRNVGKLQWAPPPAGGRPWPLAMQFDANDGVLMSVSGASRLPVQTAAPFPPGSAVPDPIYRPQPAALVGLGVSRVVAIRAVVGTDGSVGTAVVAETSGLSEADAAALDCVRQWVFIPATIRGAYVARAVLLHFSFPKRTGSKRTGDR